MSKVNSMCKKIMGYLSIIRIRLQAKYTLPFVHMTYNKIENSTKIVAGKILSYLEHEHT